MAKDYKKQAKEILRLAEESGLQGNFFFATTFERYLVQLQILEALQAEINTNGLTVEKTYVKGKSNVYSSPCVSDFNRTTDSANKTVATLMRILKNYGAEDNASDDDPLLNAINGDDETE